MSNEAIVDIFGDIVNGGPVFHIWDNPFLIGFSVRGGLFLHTMSALRSTVLLTAVSLFSQGVGFVYRVFLSRMVGAEVMGLYQLVLPVSSVLMSLTAVGFTAACSNLSARYRATGNDKAAHQTLGTCLWGFLVAFGVVALAVAPFSDAVSVHLLGDARSRLGLLLLLPCVLLTGIENIHKHFFYGSGNVRPPAFTEIFEPLIRAGAVLGLLWWFLPQNPERTVGLIVCGMILCEVFSAAALTLLYRRFMGRNCSGEGAPRQSLVKKILHISIPIGLTSLLGNLMGAATAVIIPQRLVQTGQNVSSAMGDFGILCGMTLPLLTLPTAFISAMGLVLLPRMAQSAALGRWERCRRQANKAVAAAAFLLFPSSALLAVLAQPLGRLLFREEAAGQFALPLAVAVALSGLESVFAICLNALGKQSLTACHGLICGGVQLLLTWYRMTLPGVGLRGYVDSLLVSTVLGVVLHWNALRRVIALRPRLFPWLVGPGLAALLSGLCARLLFTVLLSSGLGEGAACLACLLFGILIYLCAMAAQGLLHRPQKAVSPSPV